MYFGDVAAVDLVDTGIEVDCTDFTETAADFAETAAVVAVAAARKTYADDAAAVDIDIEIDCAECAETAAVVAVVAVAAAVAGNTYPVVGNAAADAASVLSFAAFASACLASDRIGPLAVLVIQVYF